MRVKCRTLLLYSKFYILLPALILSLFIHSKLYASVKINNLPEDKQLILQKIELYLNSIDNLSADFIQTYQNTKSYGKFYLSRPGKMRIEYNSSPEILITVNKSVLTYKDIELDEISSLSTNTTPASFLTRKNISFKAKDIIIDNFQVKRGETFVTVIKKNRPEAGKFKIVFDPQITKFIRLEVVNDLNETVIVKLNKIKYPHKLSSNLFYIKSKNLPF